MVLALAACSPARLQESVTFLDDLSQAAHGGDLSDQRTSRTSITFAADGDLVDADLYIADDALAGLILVPGAAPAGRDDARLVALAGALARARFLVLVPEMERLRSLQVSSADAPLLAAAARHLRVLHPERPLGLSAVSFAAGPAVLAIDAGAPVDFLITVGGYYDLEAVITFLTTGYFRPAPDAGWRYRAPNAYGKWVFLLSNVDRLENKDDRTLLRAMGERRLSRPDADVTDLVERLSVEGTAVYALLSNRDPDNVPALIARLPIAIRGEIRALDLKRLDLREWRTRQPPVHVVAVHGAPDPVIPETQSAAFVAALGENEGRLYIVRGLGHVELERVGVAGSLTMLRAAYRVLTLRDVGRSRRERP